MKLPRRNFLHLAAGAAVLPTASRFAWAQTYPTRPVRIFVGFPAGFTPDIVARLVGQPLSVRLGQQFVVENRPGAAGNLATEAVVRRPRPGPGETHPHSSRRYPACRPRGSRSPASTAARAQRSATPPRRRAA